MIFILWMNVYHWSLFCELTCTVYHFALNNIKIFKFLNSNSYTFVSLPQPYRNSPPPAPAKSLHAIWERRVSLSRRIEQASKVRKAGNKEKKSRWWDTKSRSVGKDKRSYRRGVVVFLLTHDLYILFINSVKTVGR